MKEPDYDGLASNCRATRLERILVWAGGYQWHLVAGEPAEYRAPIRALGEAVFAAAAIAAINWTIAGYAASEGADARTRLIAATLSGLIALAVLLMLDRGTLFFADTMPAGRGYALALWVVLRSAITVAVSGITAQAIMPMILASELRGHALHMQEQSEARRLGYLNSRFEVIERKKAATTAIEEAARIEKQATILPVDIRNRLTDASRCLAIYQRRKAAVIASGLTDVEAKNILKVEGTRCGVKQSAARNEQAAYDAKMRLMLRDAEERKGAAEAQMKTAMAAVSERIDQAAVVEKQALNTSSAVVLADLLRTNLAAKTKWALVTLIMVAFELLPLLMKLLAGKSTIGLRLSARRAVETIIQAEQVASAQHDATVTRTLGDAMQGAILSACQNQEVSQFCSRLFATKLRTFVPLEVVTVLLRDIELKQRDIDQAMRRYPRYAGAISQVWSQAMREVAELFTADDSHARSPNPTTNKVGDFEPSARAA